jgi:hypothetical protein
MGSFWWKDLLSLNKIFRGVATCTARVGNTVSLWEDNFMDQTLATKFLVLTRCLSAIVKRDKMVNYAIVKRDKMLKCINAMR